MARWIDADKCPCLTCDTKDYDCYTVHCEEFTRWRLSSVDVVKVETNFYDHEEIYPDCTVQVLTNTATGEVSVGWWKNETD